MIFLLSVLINQAFAQCDASAKGKCLAPFVWLDQTCICCDSSAKDKCAAPNTWIAEKCFCQQAPTCDASAKDKCIAPNTWIAEKCVCLQPPSCDASAKDKCVAPNTWIAEKCFCQQTQPPTCDASAKDKCLAPNTWIAEKCVCLPPPSCDASAKDKCVAPNTWIAEKCFCQQACDASGKDKCVAPNTWIPEKCYCQQPTTCDASGKEKCLAPNTWIPEKCFCQPATQCDPVGVAQKCKLNGWAVHPTNRCDCCDAASVEARCKSANLAYVAETCSCGKATTCDAVSLRTKCAQVAGTTANFDTCVCDMMCPDGSLYAAAKLKCALGGGYIGDVQSCQCIVSSDACKSKGLDAAAYEVKCKDAGYAFDAVGCNCIAPQVCPTIKCSYKMDPVKCVCIPPPCELTADKVGAAIACNGEGFTFNADTCSCVAVCPKTSAFAGVPLEDAYKKCLSANGEFDRATCTCKQSTMTCNTFAPCGARQTLNPQTCVCEDACPDGRLYATAKIECVIKQKGTFEPLTCGCTWPCTGDVLTQLTAKCDSVKGTVNTKTCTCDTSTSACDPTARATASLASDCALKGRIFNSMTCECLAPVSTEPICKQGDYATLKAACFAKNANANWNPATCECTQPCRALAAIDAKPNCPTDQTWNANTCTCEGGCSEFGKDVANQLCAVKGMAFDGRCGCITLCDAKEASVGATDCKTKGGVFNYVTCSCAVPTKCDDATAAKLKANCVEKGWVWDGPNCSCTDSKKLVLTVKDPQLSPELQQKIQQLANKCGVEINKSGENKFDVTFATTGADALACAFDRDATVKALQSDDSIGSIEVAPVELIATEPPSSAAVAQISLAVIAVVLSLMI